MIKTRRLILAIISSTLMLLLSGCKAAILNPQGTVAVQEKQIILFSAALMLIVVIPVILLSFIFAWRYRATNTEAIYAPEWSHNTTLEVIWWSIPCIMICILGVITWISAHQLDPYRSLADKQHKAITIEAIALDWKWLFIYPEQNIATINVVEFPANVPVQFLVSADGAMNSLQIPQLAGQIYAMAGMQTKLSIIANHPGDYQGFSASFSGDGFSDMRFIAHATSEAQFNDWIKTVKKSPNTLTMNVFHQLQKPSKNNAVTYFSSANSHIFMLEKMKSMMPQNGEGS